MGYYRAPEYNRPLLFTVDKDSIVIKWCTDDDKYEERHYTLFFVPLPAVE